MSPRYIFRIDDLAVNPKFPPVQDPHGTWMPPTSAGSNYLRGGGISGFYWYCTGTDIKRIITLPTGAIHFSTYSIYYHQGFWISDCDASRSTEANPWRKLSFEHHPTKLSSHLTIAGTQHTLRTQRPEQRWPRMLLPDIYHAPESSWAADGSSYGGLTGELPILLALIVFSVSKNNAETVIHNCVSQGEFQVHSENNGRVNERGLVVRVWTCPGQTADELNGFEDGNFGNYYN